MAKEKKIEEKIVEKLLTSKKKLETGKWLYRGFVVEKNGSKWVAKVHEGSNIVEEKSDSVVDELMTSAKNICISIDKVLGDLTDSEKTKPKRAIKSKASRLKDKDEKAKYIERAQRVAYDIRNGLQVLSFLNKKKLKDNLLSDAPNMRKTLSNGYRLGWENGCLYNVPEITDEIKAIIEKDKEFIEELKVKHEDLNISFGMEDNKIDIEVTYKEK